MHDFAVEQVRLHLNAALKIAEDAGLWFLLARVELRARQVDAAEYALSRAQVHGFPRERLLPYIAELRFLQRRFADVRGLFAELGDQPGIPALAQSRIFWPGLSLNIARSCGHERDGIWPAAESERLRRHAAT
jgi:hypothetical protein